MGVVRGVEKGLLQPSGKITHLTSGPREKRVSGEEKRCQKCKEHFRPSPDAYLGVDTPL